MIADLSRAHHPVSTLFAQPLTTAAWDRYRLSEDQVRFYNLNGYVSGIPLLDDAQLEQLRAELDQLTDSLHPARSLFYEYHSNESANPATVLFHALGAWRATPGFHDLLWNPAFLMPASQLLGSGVRFWHDQIFYKPAHHGGIVAWHQDYSYWTRTKPIAHLSCWIALDDATRENGCVHYVPGSHLWNLLPVSGLADQMDAINALLSIEQKEQFKPVPIELTKGQASFHHPLMVHGSYENRTDRPRRGTVINVFSDGVVSASDQPLLAGVPLIPSGKKIEGQFFPLLFDQR